MHPVNKYFMSTHGVHQTPLQVLKVIAVNKDLVLVELNVSEYISKFKNENKFLKLTPFG